MTEGFSRQAVNNNTSREPAAIIGVDLTTKTATALTRSKYTVAVDCSYAIGETYVMPAVGEQWYIERFDMVWRLSAQIPFNDPTVNIEPEEGQRSVGSATGPLELNGTEVRANGPLRIGTTFFRTNADTGKLEYSLDGDSYVPVGGAGGGGGDIDSTDDLPEGSTNKYYTDARASVAAPVQTVAARTGNVTLTKTDVGLSAVDNTADTAKPISTPVSTALASKADLVSGTVPDAQLPLPAVRPYANVAAFPGPGVTGVIYMALDTGLLYRWDGAAYGFAGGGGGGGGGAANTDELPEGTTNLYYTNTRVQALFGTTVGTIAQGNDSRLSNTRTPTDNTVTTAKIVDANVTLAKLASDVQASIAASPYDLSYPQTFGARAVGYGLNQIGVQLQRAVVFTKVTYRCQTSDATGSSTFEVRKNGAAVSGTSVTVAAISQVAGASATGSWSFAAGDILTVYTTAVGTTPGIGLVADLKGDA